MIRQEKIRIPIDFNIRNTDNLAHEYSGTHYIFPNPGGGGTCVGLRAIDDCGMGCWRRNP